ncbi:hypothetical protein BJ508DRAFT_330660 [Ascobolus immersus RN42]|uniref:Extracellular membrane protein CFEM domain-containing protein n=1 Tax=Ascobolus immersus RN42 TaxID=1160509 RepID=A0A3N4HY56_ASCIM|nr:hypothetical protein BJ508DRAFT_330660 [Ascobolus immersus RN42]
MKLITTLVLLTTPLAVLAVEYNPTVLTDLPTLMAAHAPCTRPCYDPYYKAFMTSKVIHPKCAIKGTAGEKVDWGCTFCRITTENTTEANAYALEKKLDDELESCLKGIEKECEAADENGRWNTGWMRIMDCEATLNATKDSKSGATVVGVNGDFGMATAVFLGFIGYITLFV